MAQILTPIYGDVFRFYGVVDQPDRARKQHHYPMPLVGGLAIAISYFFGLPASPSLD
jgi:UDP-N-acetylmuramyl pentapeptide phosphotransferase/UDP-N-acetylglucosamine-1-phosphate transferase